MPYTSFSSVHCLYRHSPSFRDWHVCLHIHLHTRVYMCEIYAKRTHEKYLQEILHQESESITCIQTDTHMPLPPHCLSCSHRCFLRSRAARHVRESRSRRNFVSSFSVGFVLAYAHCWRLALAMSSIHPLVGVTGVIMTRLMSKYTHPVSSPPLPPSPPIRSLKPAVVQLPRKSFPPHVLPTPSAPRRFCVAFTMYTFNKPFLQIPCQ